MKRFYELYINWFAFVIVLSMAIISDKYPSFILSSNMISFAAVLFDIFACIQLKKVN